MATVQYEGDSWAQERPFRKLGGWGPEERKTDVLEPWWEPRQSFQRDCRAGTVVVALQPGEGTFFQGCRGNKPTGAEQQLGDASVWRHILPQSILWGESLGNHSILEGGTHFSSLKVPL